ncbi:lytic murein transglycosylase [Yersinia vastinensis]|uniref:lytic murein transglycosylase n=1 Tax=Yersinia vastinensis TaxID=2890318 RepID=UPI0005DBBB4E|nr:lytic murein transglycosylase [Yersinia vastinensis]OVZ96360.1 lytic murein transglycosylase [Yersinia frederiksenii]CNI80305.1 membrane-bound lytic murein transglycosylase B [Yersinia frederiksenii]CNI98881.1 membrane-bound lytic murein transglycosylase B [Yersinia frederiksenii]CNL28402.1 membrane-bound lytic murein transglycosylase B [Yersinia frederiksenii]
MKLSIIAIAVTTVISVGCSSKNAAAPIPTQPSAQQVEADSGAAAAASVNKNSTTTTLSQQGRDPAQFPAYVEQLKAHARAQGISRATLDIAFANIHFVDRVIQSDRNQLEKKVTLDDYLSKVLTAKKIEQGKAIYRRYQPQLSQATARYGVPERYIVALWGLESGFGKIQGKEDVISALSTLAFEGRREAFFTKELMAALKIIQQGRVEDPQLKGSWAGAMGQSQFMPSSFLNYGADGDGDGKIDIWNNIDDVFASTANYLSTEGWTSGIGWGQEVQLPKGFNVALAGLKDNQAKTIGQWQRLGIKPVSGKKITHPELRAWVIVPDDVQGRAFLVYDNFRTIMHWNRSYYFAISIGMMADSVGQ